MEVRREPPLVSGQLDRDAATRADPALLHAAWQQPDARVLRIRDGRVPLRSVQAGELELALAPTRGELGDEHYFVGRVGGAPYFAMAVAEDAADRAPVTEWRHPFLLGDELSSVELEVMTVSFALVNWHRSAGFSPRDGESTTPALGGWARHDAHGGEHFPRTDPAVIVLVEHEGRVLLGSNALWEADRFSLLAGFVEAGESLEQTVRREVFEEAGIRVEDVRYVASQPWPFPRSLMLGFRAKLAAGDDPERLVPDVTEISALRWFSRDELRSGSAGIRLPGGLSIARWLLDLWLDEDDSASAGVDAPTEAALPEGRREGRSGR